ncbi:hypothetical protein BUALT_Bualt07G0082400 [Buddleja alternifolia]|uniref:C3HC-type domain-containing protein n=1 Tax=Buddleja alternifolia TaxID=168488 RepID=A0AAV6XAE0_9LAMI|nr:hypothetical protein BUALT_Bualt07G0082400 [Buddleja alternifolia]
MVVYYKESISSMLWQRGTMDTIPLRMTIESGYRFYERVTSIWNSPRVSHLRPILIRPEESWSQCACDVGSVIRVVRPYSPVGGVDLEVRSHGQVASQAPSCRPWDRGDLFRRLSTFKSMTWFAKPQVLSPLDCARKGWVNVDIDTLRCTSCDARLLFSTPSVWTQQQGKSCFFPCSSFIAILFFFRFIFILHGSIEKAAMFPIVSRSDLIEDYKKRFLALSKLIALPVILPGAAANRRSPQLDQFLTEFSTSGYLVPVEIPRTESPGDIPESVSSISYYQAQKLISLFGWEPHMLPYVVDFKDGENQSIKDANIIVTTGQKQKINVHSLCANEGTKTSSELQLDPCSVVLDCKLCGASVGLWAFCTIPRPVEYLRFVGLTEVNGKNVSTHDEVSAQGSPSGNEIHGGNREGITDTVTTASTSLGFTIAGGPPPGMLNYGATISLPVLGQSLRARFPIETETDQLAIQMPSLVEDEQMSLESEKGTTQGTSATTRLDVIAKNPSEVPQTAEEGSILNVNLSGTVGTINSIVEADKFACANGICREDEKLQSSYRSMEFDPIKQHRHFCPWIESNGKFEPGWQQTLSALEGNNELSFSSPNNVPSYTLIEVDDPVASVKKLFTSPNGKRTKILVKAKV